MRSDSPITIRKFFAQNDPGLFLQRSEINHNQLLILVATMSSVKRRKITGDAPAAPVKTKKVKTPVVEKAPSSSPEPEAEAATDETAEAGESEEVEVTKSFKDLVGSLGVVVKWLADLSTGNHRLVMRRL